METDVLQQVEGGLPWERALGLLGTATEGRTQDEEQKSLGEDMINCRTSRACLKRNECLLGDDFSVADVFKQIVADGL